MKKFIKRMNDSGLSVVIVMLLCLIFGIADAGAMTADVAPSVPIESSDGRQQGVAANGDAYNRHEGMSVEFTEANVEQLLLKEIDKEIVKINRYRYPLDTIARSIGKARTKKSSSQVIEYYSVATLPSDSIITAAYAGGDVSTPLTFGTGGSENSLIAVNQTLIVKGVKGFKVNGKNGTTEQDTRPLILYVTDRHTDGRPIVIAVNGQGATFTIPAIPANSTITIAGRAASEFQIRTDVYNILPTPTEQYLQKFIAEVEESTFFAMRDKEVSWTISDVVQQALDQMRKETNNSYWRGVKSIRNVKNKYNRKPEDTYFTEGIWTQPAKDLDAGGTSITAEMLIDWMNAGFSDNAASDTKLLMCSPDFMASLCKAPLTQNMWYGAKKDFFGLKVTPIESPFGTLVPILDKSMVEAGLQGCGFMLDADYMTKWTMGWRSEKLDNVANGEADSQGRLLIEPSGLTLSFPDAHARLYLNRSQFEG
ncbi:MAG: hypothetical protein LBL79_02625 [Prevotella sp.]|nr:hypothetical protein [Prevotella sp.]